MVPREPCTMVRGSRYLPPLFAEGALATCLRLFAAESRDSAAVTDGDAKSSV